VLTSGLLQLGFATAIALALAARLGGVLQYLFPIATVVTAMVIERRSLPGYLSFVVWLWMLTPLVRRVADLQSGWHEPSLILLAPYGASAYPAAREAMAAVVRSIRVWPRFEGLGLFVVAGIGALKGPLHGGAPGLVLDMLDAIGAPERATGWIDGALRAGRRLMGMGHRIYRVRDPRAAVLEKAVAALEQADVAGSRLRLARATESAAQQALAARHADRPLRTNVEFYTAVLLEAVGLPREAFTPTFAVGRVAGWCAHVAEQRRVGKLIRPSATYVGPLPAPDPANP